MVCVASRCPNDLPTTPGHAPGEVAAGLLQDLLPDVDLKHLPTPGQFGVQLGVGG